MSGICKSKDINQIYLRRELTRIILGKNKQIQVLLIFLNRDIIVNIADKLLIYVLVFI